MRRSDGEPNDGSTAFKMPIRVLDEFREWSGFYDGKQRASMLYRVWMRAVLLLEQSAEWVRGLYELALDSEQAAAERIAEYLRLGALAYETGGPHAPIPEEVPMSEEEPERLETLEAQFKTQGDQIKAQSDKIAELTELVKQLVGGGEGEVRKHSLRCTGLLLREDMNNAAFRCRCSLDEDHLGPVPHDGPCRAPEDPRIVERTTWPRQSAKEKLEVVRKAIEILEGTPSWWELRDLVDPTYYTDLVEEIRAEGRREIAVAGCSGDGE